MLGKIVYLKKLFSVSQLYFKLKMYRRTRETINQLNLATVVFLKMVILVSYNLVYDYVPRQLCKGI